MGSTKNRNGSFPSCTFLSILLAEYSTWYIKNIWKCLIKVKTTTADVPKVENNESQCSKSR